MLHVDSSSKRIKYISSYVKDALSSSKGSRFRQNFVKVAKANLLAQALSLIAAPFLTRLYTPADYGTVALFSSLLGILLAFATLRFDWSVPNATSRTQAVALLVIGFLALTMVSITTFIVLWLFGSNWTFWQGFQVLGPYLLLLPVALVGSGLHQLMQAWFVREANLTAVSRTKITQSVAGTGLNIVGGVLRLGAWGLIVSSVVAAWVGIGTLLRHATGLRAGLARLSVTKIKISWLRFWRESVLSTFVALINTASLTVTPLLLAQFYSTAEVGWYALMLRLAIVPIGMFTVAIGQSFWSEAASLVKTDRAALRRLYLRSSKRLALLALPVVVVCLLGPLYVGFVFGEEWAYAGYILAALTPLLFGQIVVSPLSHLVVHRKQHWQLIWDIVRFVLVFLVLMMMGRSQASFALLILVISSINLVMYGLVFLLNLKCLPNEKTT
jgi:O-antigen/teichoic acid export membrane protein